MTHCSIVVLIVPVVVESPVVALSLSLEDVWFELFGSVMWFDAMAQTPTETAPNHTTRATADVDDAASSSLWIISLR